MIGLGCLAVGFIFLIIWSLGESTGLQLLSSLRVWCLFSLDGGSPGDREAENDYFQTKSSSLQTTIELNISIFYLTLLVVYLGKNYDKLQPSSYLTLWTPVNQTFSSGEKIQL